MAEPMTDGASPAQRNTRLQYAQRNVILRRKAWERKRLGRLLNLPTDKQQLRAAIEAATIGQPIIRYPSKANDQSRTSHPTASHRAIYAKLKRTGV